MKKRLWMILVLPVLASLACSFFGAAEEAVQVGKDAATQAAEVATEVGEEVATQPPAEEEAESETEGEASGEDAAPDLSENALANLNSYRARLSTQWIPEEGDPISFVMEQEHTRDPAAERIVMEGFEGEEGEGFEWIQIEDKSWYCMGDTCTETQADADEMASNFEEGLSFNPSDFTDDTEFRSAGRETVNGIRTKHYILDLSKTEVAFLAQGNVENVEGEAWVANESDLPSFVVRFQMTWEETRGEQPGTAEFVYDVYEVNAPITIEPPAAAETSGLPEDVPSYPDASEVVSMGGMTTFITPDDVSTTADYYRKELAAQGWTNESDDDLGEMVNQVWKKDDRTLTLMISSEDEGSNVLITIE